MRIEPNKVTLFGHTVELPFRTALPLAPAEQQSTPFLKVSLEPIDNPETEHVLDDAVKLQFYGNTVAIVQLMDLGALALEHYAVDHAVPNGLAHLGKIIIHAAGLTRNGVGILLAGKSGAGKSTTCTYLMNAGWNTLGDDAIGLYKKEGLCCAQPSYAGIRLHPNEVSQKLTGSMDGLSLVAEYGQKIRLDDSNVQFVTNDVGMHLLLLLEDGSKFTAERLGAAECCSLLGKHQFNPPTAPVKAVQRLSSLTDLATTLTAYRLRYERISENLEKIQKWLENLEYLGRTDPAREASQSAPKRD